MSSSSLDLSLPPTPRLLPAYHFEPIKPDDDPNHGQDPPAALYTLVHLSEAELGDLQVQCASKDLPKPENSVLPAPQTHFVGQPLRAVFDYHQDMTRAHRRLYEVRYFIVAIDKDWRDRGVIVVSLVGGEWDVENPDWFRTKPENAADIIVSLQLGVMGWEELKGYLGLDQDNPENSCRRVDDQGDDDNDDEGSDKWGTVRDDDGPPAPRKKPPIGYNVAVYIHSSLSEDEVAKQLENGHWMKKRKDYVNRVQAALTPTSTSPLTPAAENERDLIGKAARLHPLRCRKNPFLHRQYIIVVGSPNPEERGMLMVRLGDWWEKMLDEPLKPGETKTRRLHSIGRELQAVMNPCVRIPYHWLDGMVDRGFYNMANGHVAWPEEEEEKWE